MATYKIYWKDRGGFPGGYCESFESQNQAAAKAEFSRRFELLSNRNFNLRLGHEGACLKNESDRQIAYKIFR